jgi:hypothetical protein
MKKDNILLVLSPLYVIRNSKVIDYYTPKYVIISQVKFIYIAHLKTTIVDQSVVEKYKEKQQIAQDTQQQQKQQQSKNKKSLICVKGQCKKVSL